MQYKKSVPIITAFTCFIISSSAFRLKSDEDYKGTLPFFLGNRPRITIFSKPADPEAPKLTGPNILGHVGNVVHGGTIRVELGMQPIPGLHDIIGNAKKIIPGGQTYPQEGRPENQKPPPEPYDPPKGDNWETDEDHHVEDSDWSIGEDEKDWIPEDSDKPVPSGPSWEDIGEDPEDDPSIPYEEIINPRVRPQKRPKRSILKSRNSKIYHVPVLFRSNGKPFQFRLRTEQKSINSISRK